METRQALFAGSWYPGNPSDCEKTIQEYLKEGEADQVTGKKLFGGIVPHAGWHFSGSIAGNVIHAVSKGDATDTVVLYGMHLHAGSPAYLMAEGAWETPFGPLEIDTEMAQELAGRFEFQLETPKRFTQDNTIELQLPFVKYFFKDAKILPIGAPPADKSLNIAQAVAEIAADKGRRLKVIGSTDLTHYGFNYGFTPKGTGADALNWVKYENDRRFIDALMAMDPPKVIAEGVENHNACCAGAAASAVETARKLGARKAESVAYATSYDKHPGDSFVGYVGIVFE